MNKKAMTSVIYTVIIGFVLFIIVAVAFGSAIRDVLRGEGDFKVVEILTTAIDEVGAQGAGSIQLIPLQMDEDMGIYIFLKEEMAIIESIDENAIQMYGNKAFILRPDECDISKNCLCACNQLSFSKASEYEVTKLKNEYGAAVTGLSQTSNIVCKSIKCQTFESDFVQTTKLEQIFNTQTYDRIKDEAISNWENGFSFWRLSDAGRNYFYTSKYIDAYAVKLTDGKVALCFDPDCRDKIE